MSSAKYSSHASKSRRLKAAAASRTISTFSCDIARAVSREGPGRHRRDVDKSRDDLPAPAGAPSVDSNHHVRGLDHGGHLGAFAEGKIVDGFDRDRGHDPLPGHLKLDVGNRLPARDASNSPTQLISSTEL